MRRKNWVRAFIRIISLLAIFDCKLGAHEPEIVLPSSQRSSLSQKFSKFYEPVRYQVNCSIPFYSLPLTAEKISNYSQFRGFLSEKGAPELLLKNGFVVLNWGAQDEVVKFYEELKKIGVPIFITSDSLLHLYHIQFDETLKRIEEKEFYSALVQISEAMQAELLKRMKTSADSIKPAYLKGIAYFTVGLKLLKPELEIPAMVRDKVKWELEQIEKHQGFPSEKEARENAIFGYAEDYSQYVPRGHYTQSENLKRYFLAMMWYGRMTMLLKGEPKFGPLEKALVSPEEAKIQTILASIISGIASELKLGQESLLEKWERIYGVTAYYVGFSDDLTIYEYQDALRSVLGNKFKPSQLADAQTFFKLQVKLSQMRKPAIYSGTGESGINLELEPNQEMTPEQLLRTLDKTQGFRFMGQRYVPDSFILGKMVSPTIGQLQGTPCFTTHCIPDLGCVRVFPRGLDVMAVLGSKRALTILDQLGDSKYLRYSETFSDLKKQFDALTEKDWNQNLYRSWLYVLKALLNEPEGKGGQSFMLTDAWKDKQLNTALGSWSSLRHDTILYVKQSYTMRLTTSALQPEPQFPVKGYVEPVPEFYARLIALTRMTEKGLSDLKVLDPESQARIHSLEQVLTRLLDISLKELANQELTEADYEFIKNFADQLNAIVTGSGEATQKTTMIADVHTDQNTNQVLEQGSGYLRLMLVVYRLPQGNLLLGAGPVYSYYEFKHPIANRLTDEKWREMLKQGKAPSLPEWTKTFALF